MKATLFAKASWDQKCFKNANFGHLVLDSLMWKLYPNPPEAESWALHPRDVVPSLAAAMSVPGGRSPPPVPSAEDVRQQSPATAPAPAGTVPPGQGRGLSQGPGPRSEPESEAVPGGPWERGISAPHLLRPPGQGALQVSAPNWGFGRRQGLG